MQVNPPAIRPRAPANPGDNFTAMTPMEVAILFRVDAKTLVLWEDKGKLPPGSSFRTLGGHRRYFESVIDAVLAEQIDNPDIRRGMIEQAKRDAKEKLKTNWKVRQR